MAEGKKSFQLYTEWIEVFEALDDKDAGQLIKHIFKYVNDQNPETENALVKLSFIQIRQQLKRDLVKWEGRAEASKANGAKGGRPKNLEKPLGYLPNLDKPRKPVEVKVKVEVEDKVKVKVEDNKEKVYNKNVHDCYFNCLKFFPEHLHPKDPTTWLDTIEKLNRIEGLEFNIIEGVVKKTRNDDFWSKNFLAIPKLRKKDQNGVMYILVFNERINNNGQSGNDIAEAKEYLKSRGYV